MKYDEQGKWDINARERFILIEASDTENSILYNDTPGGKPDPEVIAALMGYASLVSKTDPSNAEDAILLALEMFGDVDHIKIDITAQADEDGGQYEGGGAMEPDRP